MAEPRITPESIEAARLEFLRRDEEGIDFDHVVIARNVTIPELCTAQREWFDNVTVALLTDGSLVITDVRSAMTDAIMAELRRQLGDYARANGMVVLDRPPVAMPGTGFRSRSLILALAPPTPGAGLGDAMDEDDDARRDDRSDGDA